MELTELTELMPVATELMELKDNGTQGHRDASNATAIAVDHERHKGGDTLTAAHTVAVARVGVCRLDR